MALLAIPVIDEIMPRCRLTTTGTTSGSQHAQMLYDKWILDVPKLLDLAAIYGPDNTLLLQKLLQQVPHDSLA